MLLSNDTYRPLNEETQERNLDHFSGPEGSASNMRDKGMFLPQSYMPVSGLQGF